MKPVVRQHEHEFEPQYGLPERLPADERLLWQGAPNWLALARRAFHVYKLAAYFVVILALRASAVLADGSSAGDALRAVLMLAPLFAIGIGLALLLARLAASTCAYTITDKRVVMRIGIVLSVTYNLPLRCINAADLRPLGAGVGDIALALHAGTRIAYLQLWPHARPWRLAQPEPMLRCLPDAEHVASLLAQAWSQAHGTAARPAAMTRPEARAAAGPRPVMAGH
jgi:Bacterial PH domain